MRLQEILAAIPGLEKRFVHYLEGQGYIHPRKLHKTRIARRDYSEPDLERIRGIWTYYQRGISIQRAYELVTRQASDGAFVFLLVPTRRWHDALELLRRSDHIMEVAAVYGARSNVVARLRAPHESDVHNVLDRLVEAGLIAGLPRVLRFPAAAFWLREDARGPDGAILPPSSTSTPPTAAGVSLPLPAAHHAEGHTPMRAWVLITVPAKQIGGLVEELRTYPGVVEASAIYGETDVIAKVEVPDQDALDELVMERIQRIAAVESTRTFIAIGNLHWRRG